MKQRLIIYLQDRLQEPSTWRGIILLTSSLFGFTLSPDTNEALILLALSLSGTHGIVTKG